MLKSEGRVVRIMNKKISEKRKEYLLWKEYFLLLMLAAAARSKDPSTQVGACIVNKENQILSIGYNGLTKGMNDDEMCWASIGEITGETDKIKDPYIVHAERNAILNFRGSLSELKDTTMYVLYYPCTECTKEIIQAGIKHVIYLRKYKPTSTIISEKMFRAAGVITEPYNEEKDYTKESIQGTMEKIQRLVKELSE